jgi:hypothetical protein
MTDPQDDIPCTACEVEGSRSRLDEDGLCPGCRTPAGRLVTALMEINVDSEIGRRFVNVGCLIVDTNEDGDWSIDGHNEDGITAADAIAAIVQAPGLRADRDTLAARVKELEAHNGRMVAQINALAEACERAPSSEDGALVVCDALPGRSWRDAAAALRNLAGGAS